MPTPTPPSLICLGRAGSSDVPDWGVPRRLRSFALHVSVYEPSAAGSRAEFTVRCLFDESPRWKNWEMPRKDSLMQVCGDLLGSYMGEGDVYPAMLGNDLVYINTPRRGEDTGSTPDDSGSVDSVPLTPQKRRMMAFNNRLRPASKTPAGRSMNAQTVKAPVNQDRRCKTPSLSVRTHR